MNAMRGTSGLVRLALACSTVVVVAALVAVLPVGSQPVADSGVRLVTPHGSRVDGWVLVPVGGNVHQQYVGSGCRSSLVAAGAVVEVVDYRREIAGLPRVPRWRSCDELAQLVTSTPTTVPTTGSSTTTSSTPVTSSTVPSTTMPVTTVPSSTVPVTTVPTTGSSSTASSTTVTSTTVTSTTVSSSTVPVTTVPTTGSSSTASSTTVTSTTVTSTTVPVTVPSTTVLQPGGGSCIVPDPFFETAVPTGGALAGDRPRVFVTTDIRPFDHPGEYDDKLSMTTLMLFLDVLDLEGVAGDPGPINRILADYAKDLPNLRSHSDRYPDPDSIDVAAARGGHGAAALLAAAKRADDRPLYVLVWGGYHVVSQAFDLAAQEGFDLASRLRIVSIGAGNVRKGSAPSAPFGSVYDDQIKPGRLWAVLDQVGFTGIHLYPTRKLPPGAWDANRGFVSSNIAGHGHLGDTYASVHQTTRMGDFPTVLYLLRGDPDVPDGEHWGGRFVALTAAHRFGHGAGDVNLPTFFTDQVGGGQSYTNPWGRAIAGSRDTVARYAMQWLPELSARYDRAAYRFGANPDPVDVFRYTDRCR